MRLATFAAAVGFGVCAMAASADAMPAAPLSGVSTGFEQVAFGCGPGFHPGPRGRCVRNQRFFRPRPAFRAPLRACPRGFRLSPAGRCRPNL